MKAILCERPGALALVERPAPEPRPGEVLVRIRRVGVCGTDFHIFKGDHPYLAYPRIIGHELAGEVAAVGAGASLTVGQRVCVLPYLACGRCVACRRGRTNCCTRIEVLGVHRDGGLCEYLTVPEGYALPADDISLEQAAMVEFLSIGAHGVRRSGLTAADRVLVLGAGPIGLAVMLFAGLRGATVTAVDVRAERLAVARDGIGVAETVEAGADLAGRLACLTDGEFFDVVFDCTSNLASMQRGLDYVAHGGTYVLLSIVPDAIAFPDPEFHKRETTLLASRNATAEDFRTVIAALRGGQVPTATLATHRGGLAEVPSLLPVWMRPESGVIKALVEV
ncbi:MAG: zinc-binding alcohol dehydrogenase family protein [Rhodospirillaceae bacterium]|nr:zinc-binding alcohol dehydrogenase family protein [Rhodospirillaceae bacterium]